MSSQAGSPSTDLGFVAIDLGTSTSYMAHTRAGKAALVTDPSGEAAFPSVLALSAEGGILAGAPARDRQALHPADTLLGIKALLASSAEELNAWGPFFPHPVAFSASGMLQVQVGGRPRSSLELAALYLASLRTAGEMALEQPMRSAVITVPTCFGPFERQALRLAAQMAGFYRVRLIDESTAVGLAWADQGGRGCVGVCSWGAGYLNMSILEIKSGLVRVLASGGTAAGGGDLVDRQIARDFLAEVCRSAGQLSNEAHVARHVLALAQAAKHDLGARGKASLQLKLATGTGAVKQVLAAEALETCLAPLKEAASQLAGRLLRAAGLSSGDVDLLLLAGGMINLPALREHAAGLLGRELDTSLDLEHAAVLGAQVRARLLEREGDDLLVIDELPSSIGLEGHGGEMSPILERGTALPAGKREVYTTYLERQTEVAIEIFQRGLADWAPLARVEISKIPPMKAGEPALEVAFEVDEDGVLAVRAAETTRGKLLGLAVRPRQGLPSEVVEATLDGLPPEKEGNGEDDLRTVLCIRGRFILSIFNELTRRRAGIMTRDEKQLISKKSLELEDVMESADPLEIQACTQELEEIAHPLIQRDIGSSLQSLLR